MRNPGYEFVERWDRLNGRCKVRVGEHVYDVERWTMPVRIVRFTARLNGAVVAEKAKFTTLLRALGAGR